MPFFTRNLFTIFLLCLGTQISNAQSDEKTGRLIQADMARQLPFTIVIDPGHGGIDGGASVKGGTIEKNITLEFAKQLAAYLQKDTSLKVYLTRYDDRFIALDERVNIARKLNANLFLSLHADSIDDKSLRGATVYTLSDKASDALSQSIAEKENLSDSKGGLAIPADDKAVVDILMDLTLRETAQYSTTFARALIDSFKEKIILIHNPHRSAGFRVLRAAEIPSVLIEMGYLSNSEDEKQINTPAWRQSLVEETSKAIHSYIQTTTQ
jgi:N-acetylmuramoyl-L-alanine amidase